jgi:hypothetical protein
MIIRPFDVQGTCRYCFPQPRLTQTLQVRDLLAKFALAEFRVCMSTANNIALICTLMYFSKLKDKGGPNKWIGHM